MANLYFIQISYKQYKLGNFIPFALFWGRMRPKTVVPRMPSVFQSYFECGNESVCVWLSVSVLFQVWVWLPLMSVTVPYLVYPRIWVDMIYRYQFLFDFFDLFFDVIYSSYEMGLRNFERLRSVVVKLQLFDRIWVDMMIYRYQFLFDFFDLFFDVI